MSPISISQLLQVLSDPKSAEDLRIYFGINAPAGSLVFSGRRFESLGLDGAGQDDPNRFLAADLLAVQCLSVTVPIEVAIDLLEGDLGRQVSDRLYRIPPGIDLGTAGARPFVADGGDADQAWRLLEAQFDVGFVTAGKLLARKRPRLLPVWDNVVRCALGRPRSAWTWLDDLLRERDSAALSQLELLREKAGIPGNISLLRTLDVVIWMRHREKHSQSGCPGMPM